jgi:signal transduction histidine kinase
MAVSATRAERLLETGLALAAELSLPALLRRIVELAVELSGATYGALGVMSADGTGLNDFITTGLSESKRAAIGPLPRGQGILGLLIREPEPLRLADIARDARSAGFPPNHPPMRSFLGAPVRAHGRIFGNIYLTDKRDAAEFTEDDQASIVVLATQAGVAIANAHLYEEVRMRERWLGAVREVATALLAGTTARNVLELVAQHARDLADADMATVSIPDDNRLRIMAAAGTAATELVNVEVPLSGSLSADVIRSGEAILLEDARMSTLTQPMASLTGVGPMILVPVALRTSAHGVLAVGRREGRRPFHSTDIPLLESFAEQAVLALEYARAQSEIARLTMLEDRERIARDLHDGVIQSLFAVGLGLQGTAGVVGDTGLADRIQQAVGEIDGVIGDLRSYIFGLRPSMLMASNLTNALEQLAHETQERTAVTVVVDVDSSLETRLSDASTQVMQIVREALSNVGRHAEAETCRVSVRRESGAAVIEIDDDGRGFDVNASPRGMGLGNLAERASAIGGTLTIVSSPEQGTTVRVAIPL